ncbi:MAG TPA: transglutaminase family protein [Candidatus Nanoarchaeia archaeon]|nr:transglutaminase family protein [Candidatus Nanoarchaeia archaeon]
MNEEYPRKIYFSSLRKEGVSLSFICAVLSVGVLGEGYVRNLPRRAEVAPSVFSVPVPPEIVPTIETQPSQMFFDEQIVEKTLLKDGDPNIVVYYSDFVNGDKKFNLKLSEYVKYKVKDHIQWAAGAIPGRYLPYITYQDPTIEEIAAEITTGSTSKEEEARRILNFVHQQFYDISLENSPQFDYVKYPLETLVEKNGDCEDISILGLSLLKARGINVAYFIYKPQKDEIMGHFAMGIAGDFTGTSFEQDGVKYFYVEPTGTDMLSNMSKFDIGQVRDEYKDSVPKIVVVK